MGAIGARVTIFVGWIEYKRTLELITDVWEFVQVFRNLHYIMRIDVAVVHGAVNLHPLHGFHASSITTLFLPAHHQHHQPLFLPFSPSVRDFSCSRSDALTFQALGKLRASEASACAGWREGGATRST